MKPSDFDGRDWDAERQDADNPRGDVQRLRALRPLAECKRCGVYTRARTRICLGCTRDLSIAEERATS